MEELPPNKRARTSPPNFPVDVWRQGVLPKRIKMLRMYLNDPDVPDDLKYIGLIDRIDSFKQEDQAVATIQEWESRPLPAAGSLEDVEKTKELANCALLMGMMRDMYDTLGDGSSSSSADQQQQLGSHRKTNALAGSSGHLFAPVEMKVRTAPPRLCGSRRRRKVIFGCRTTVSVFQIAAVGVALPFTLIAFVFQSLFGLGA